MDIRSLKAFIAVFEERNITQASARLYLSQPALSATIRQLEQELGAELFQRQPRGVDVTDAARLLYPEARRLVEEAEGLKQLFRGRQDCLPLTLGVAADLGQADVARVLTAAYRAVDGLLLELAAGCAGDARLDEDARRCGDELFLPLWEEDYVLAMCADAPLAAQPWLRPAQLLGQDLIACGTLLAPALRQPAGRGGAGTGGGGALRHLTRRRRWPPPAPASPSSRGDWPRTTRSCAACGWTRRNSAAASACATRRTLAKPALARLKQGLAAS